MNWIERSAEMGFPAVFTSNVRAQKTLKVRADQSIDLKLRNIMFGDFQKLQRFYRHLPPLPVRRLKTMCLLPNEPTEKCDSSLKATFFVDHSCLHHFLLLHHLRHQQQHLQHSHPEISVNDAVSDAFIIYPYCQNGIDKSFSSSSSSSLFFLKHIS